MSSAPRDEPEEIDHLGASLLLDKMIMELQLLRVKIKNAPEIVKQRWIETLHRVNILKSALDDCCGKESPYFPARQGRFPDKHRSQNGRRERRDRRNKHHHD